MSSIKGTNVLAPVVPFDTTDTHASHEARYGKGGYRSVADVAERDAIPALRREAGMLVYVVSTATVWKLADDLTTWSQFASGAATWSELSGKPATFPPATHTHSTADITGFASAVVAAAPPTTDASLLTQGTLSASRLPASVVLTNDSRLSDDRNPLPHSQAATTITGLSAVALTGSYADLTGQPTIPPAFTLPVATASVLGGVRQGSNVTIAADGTVSVAAPVTSLPAASITGLAAVATTGAYSSLSGLPTLGTAAAASTAEFAAAIHTHPLSSLTQSGAIAGQVPTWNGSEWAPATPSSVTDGNRGDLTVSGGGATWTINASAVVTADIADSAVTDAKIASVAASKLTGTIADARLSANVLTASALAARQHQTTAVLDVTDRNIVNTTAAPVSGAVYWTFFTPSYSLTVSQISMATGSTVASGVTLARMGLYTADASGNATLVARTASDTSLFTATGNTVFTRSFDTAGGYPASYPLVAGQRYAVAVILVASATGSLAASAVPNHIGVLSPRVQGIRTGNSDLVASQGSGQFNGSVAIAYWARLS